MDINSLGKHTLSILVSVTVIALYILPAFSQQQIDPPKTVQETTQVVVKDTITIRDTIQVIGQGELPQPIVIETISETDWIAVGGHLIAVIGILVVLYQIHKSQETATRQIQANQDIVMKQAQKNYEANIESQRELIREELKVKIYADLVGSLNEYLEKLSKLEQKITNIHAVFQTSVILSQFGYLKLNITASELNESYKEVKIQKLMKLVGNYQSILGENTAEAREQIWKSDLMMVRKL